MASSSGAAAAAKRGAGGAADADGDAKRRRVEGKEPSLLNEDGHFVDAYWRAARLNDVGPLRGVVTRGNVNAQDRYGQALLHWAATYKSIGVARFLLEVGADANIRTNDMPLHDSCGMYGGNANEEMVFLLLQHGADKDAKNNDGLTPLGVCSWCDDDLDDDEQADFDEEAAARKARFESAVRRFTQYVCGVARAVDAYLYPHDVVDQIVLKYVFEAKTVNESRAALAEARRSDDGGAEEEEEEDEEEEQEEEEDE